MCKFSTTDIFKLALETGSINAAVYTEDEEGKVGHKDVFETIREEIWLEEVFGA